MPLAHVFVAAAVTAVVAVSRLTAFAIDDDKRWPRFRNLALFVVFSGLAVAVGWWLLAKGGVQIIVRGPRGCNSKGTIFGSRTVNSLFNQMGAEKFKLMLSKADPEATRIVMRVRLGGIMDQLQAAVRRELGTDRVRLEGTPRAGSRSAGWNAVPYSPTRASGCAPAETDASEAPPEEPPASGDDSVV